LGETILPEEGCGSAADWNKLNTAFYYCGLHQGPNIATSAGPDVLKIIKTAPDAIAGSLTGNN